MNANYYDDRELFRNVKNFMITSLRAQVSFGLETSNVLVLGKKNADFIKMLNDEAHIFEHIHSIEHPRFIQQYKSKEKAYYIEKYFEMLEKIMGK